MRALAADPFVNGAAFVRAAAELRRPLGLSLAALAALAALTPGGPRALAGRSVDWVKHHVIIPGTGLPPALHAAPCAPAACALPRTAPLREHCSGCHAPSAPAMEQCSGCCGPVYCGRDCQRVHWRAAHKRECSGGGAAAAGEALVFFSHPSACAAGGGCGESYLAQQRRQRPELVGRSNVYVSFAYAHGFLELVQALRAWEERQRARGARAPYFYHLDLLARSQHGEAPAAEPPCSAVAQTIADIGHTVLALQWGSGGGGGEAGLGALERLWCLYELWATTRAAPGAAFDVAMAPPHRAAFFSDLHRDSAALARALFSVACEEAGAGRGGDRAGLLRAMRAPAGAASANHAVLRALKAWLAREAREALAALPPTTLAASPQRTVLLTFLGNLLYEQGALGEAEGYFREALGALRRRAGGGLDVDDDGGAHPDAAQAAANLATVLRAAGGRSGEAEALFREALAVRRAVLGEAHAETIGSACALAALLREAGRLGEAEPLAREALGAARRALGRESPPALGALGVLGNILREAGRCSEAEPLLAEALAVRTRRHGAEHPLTLDAASNLACLVSEAGGRQGEAEARHRAVLEARTRVLGRGHVATLVSLVNCGECLCEGGDGAAAAAALALYEECGARARSAGLGEGHALTLAAVAGTAAALRRCGRLGEALPLARAAHAARLAAGGGARLDTCASAHELGVLLRRAGRSGEAAEFASAAYQGRLRAQGAGSRLTLASQLSLALLQGDNDLAASIAARGVRE